MFSEIKHCALLSNKIRLTINMCGYIEYHFWIKGLVCFFKPIEESKRLSRRLSLGLLLGKKRCYNNKEIKVFNCVDI